METKIFCVFHIGAPQQFSPPMFEYADHYVPILAGAYRYREGSSKLFDSFAKDNTGENISSLNPYLNENTAIYWVYKHYKEIGNPNMVGFCHYRRFLDVDLANLQGDTIYCHRLKVVGASARPYATKLDDFQGILLDHGRTGLRINSQIVSLFCDAYVNEFPMYRTDMELVLSDISFYDKNMFIMPRSAFFQYMEYALRCYRFLMDPTLEQKIKEMFSDRPEQKRSWLHSRCRGYFNELVNGIYLEHQRQLGVKIQTVPFTEDSYHRY